MNEYILIFSGHVSKLLMSRKCKCTLIQMNRISKYEGLLFMFDLFRGFFKQFIIIIIEHHSFYYSWASLLGRTNDEYFSWSSGSFLLFFFSFNIFAENVRLRIYQKKKKKLKAEVEEIGKHGKNKSVYHLTELNSQHRMFWFIRV